MGRLERYQRFNPEEFLKDLKKMGEEKKRLELKLEETTQLPSINNESGVRSTNISRLTETQAIKRLIIQEEIDDIERCEAAHEKAMSELSEEDAELIRGFFMTEGKPIWKFRIEYAQKHFMGDTLIYKHRKKALRRYARNIEKEIGRG